MHDLTIRPVVDGDDDETVLGLLASSLGWVADGRHAELLDWKHRQNPFGRSVGWLALDGEVPAGFRTFLRWEFRDGDRVIRAVRAVDTVTAPSHRGRGVFSALTLGGLDALAADDVAFVFNTPNASSRPGYLKMGWQVVERLAVRLRPRSPLGVVRMASARTAADKWSATATAGIAASEVLGDAPAIGRLLARVPAPGITTNRSPAYLAWRYGYEPLGYRAVLAGTAPEDGMVLFRLRRRGRATEAAITELLVPDGDRRIAGHLVREVLHRSRADHAVSLERAPVAAPGVRAPGQGPTLVWRAVCDDVAPPASSWRLALGDVELF